MSPSKVVTTVYCSAQHHGLLCEVDNEEEEEKDELCEPFFAHCKAHADKDLVKRKVRNYVRIAVGCCVKEGRFP